MVRRPGVLERDLVRAYLRGLGGALRAELLKLDKRPAVWVLLGIAIGILVLFGYLLVWLLYTFPPQGMNLPRGISPTQLKQPLYPAHLVSTTVNTGSLPSALALVLGVLLIGSEYGWGTFKTLFTQRPGRVQTLIAKLMAMEIAIGAGVVLFYFAAALCSACLAALDGQPLSEWPSADTIISGILASWLTWSWWGLFGSALAFALRQSALAIGLGLAYSFVIEGVVLNLVGGFGGEFIHTLQKFFPGPNASALASSFEMPIPGSPPHQALVGAGEASLVLVGYCIAAVVACAILVSQRDVK